MHLPVLPMTSHFYLLFLFSLTVSSPLGLEEVFFSPQDQTAHEGETVFLSCVSGDSLPPASISWVKDGKSVTRGRQIQGEYGGGNQRKTSGTLHLYNITLEDDGTYICITHNSLLNTSKWSKPAKLTVQGVPQKLQIIHGPDNITVAMGEEVSMHCAAGGFPVPMVHWFKDGCLLTNCSASFSVLNNGQLLTFRNVTKEHEGFYHCEAFNQKERIKSQKGFLLLADMDWTFIQQPLNQTVKKGDNVTVTCRPPDSRPPAQVSWFKNNQLITSAAHISVLPSGDLFFHSVQEYDSGSYFCRASNTHLQRFLTSRRATVTVLAPPLVALWPRMLTVPLGARVVLECQVSGHPLPSISWFKSSHSKQTGGRVFKGLTNATLYIHSVRSYDEGVYVCHASNSLGDSQHSAVLKVAVSPIIVTFASHVSCRIGALAVLPCRAVGIVPITYIWTKRRGNKQNTITPNEETYIDGEGSLHISNVHWSDEGEYYCTAKNRAGQHQKRSILSVTVEEHHNRVVLSGNTSTSQNMASIFDSGAEMHLQTIPPQALYKETPCLSCRGPMPAFSGGGTTPAPFHLFPPGPVSPSQYYVTQMPGLNFSALLESNYKSPSPQNQLPAPPHPLNTKYAEHMDGPAQTSQDYNPQISEGYLYRSLPQLSLTSSLLTETDSYSVTQTSMISLSTTVQAETDNFTKFYSGTLSTPVSQTRQDSLGNPRHLKNQPSMTNSKTLYSFTHRYSYLPSTLSSSKEIQSDAESISSLTSTVATPLQIQPPSVPTQQPHLDLQSYIESFTSNRLTSHPMNLQPTTMSNSYSVNQTYNSSTLDIASHVVTKSQQLNSSEEEQSMESTLGFNGTLKNTSQSPRVTLQAPSWLPVLEKHDIPIVVGVGVSLAFIFITVTFYSVIQKNDPAPTNRAAQRNVGVPTRHTGRRAAGRTYENRAFEDDDCVAVIEQSPNTSDTRARPPGPSLVTVQLEPTSEDQLGDPPPSLDLHSVTVETYPEPILDTKIDLEEECGLSLSQPSIQLQCAEDWLSSEDDNHGPYQDTLPPPSPLPSPSPSSTSKHDEGLRSLLTLHSAELCATPIHHSLSLSHGHPPLLLSHHVSLGPTNVAVDVHFHSVSPPSISVQSSTHINTNSLFTASLANTQETAPSK